MTNIDKYTFTIIVPIYNAEDFLNDCLNSIKSQTYKNYEVVLVNDGSTDSSIKICEEYLNLPNWKLVNKKNGGLTSARNFGLKHANGKYITYVDADDIIYPNHLSECEKIIHEHNDIDMITFNYDTTKNKYFIKFQAEDGFYDRKKLQQEIFPWIFSMSFNLTAWRNIYKRKLLQKHYCKDESIITGEDFAFTYECLYNSNSFYYLNKSLYLYNNDYEGNNTLSNQYCLNYIGLTNFGLYMKNNLCQQSNKQVKEQVYDFIAYFLYNNLYESAKYKSVYGIRNNKNSEKSSLWKIAKKIKNDGRIKIDMLCKPIIENAKLLKRKKIAFELVSHKHYFLSFIFILIVHKYINFKDRSSAKYH